MPLSQVLQDHLLAAHRAAAGGPRRHLAQAARRARVPIINEVVERPAHEVKEDDVVPHRAGQEARRQPEGPGVPAHRGHGFGHQRRGQIRPSITSRRISSLVTDAVMSTPGTPAPGWVPAPA